MHTNQQMPITLVARVVKGEVTNGDALARALFSQIKDDALVV